MLYTRKGDTGTSGLFGTSERYPKNAPIYEALGTLDELNSLLGYCRAQARARGFVEDLVGPLMRAQENLFVAQAELAGAEKTLSAEAVAELERVIDALEQADGNPRSFVIPGGTELSGLLHYARAVCRRAERALIGVPAERTPGPHTRAYVNRLSSLLYALARHAAVQEGGEERAPAY